MFKPNVKQILQQNLNWLVLALIFFIFGLGAAALVFKKDVFLESITEAQYDALKQMAEMIFSGPRWRGILILFFHNLIASLQMTVLGVLLGIPSLLGLFANGALMGSLLMEIGREGLPLFSFIAIGILPHGLFELPAFITCAAFGLKIGYHLVFPLPQKKRRESLGVIWKEFFTLFPLITGLLILAASIEVIVTPLLVKQFMNL
ncbi:MAG: stage II sporulation protein M [Firmicutes bacterium]|jgi:stage II sporulation protein M|nr:stage II sporulation protein M [Bacillota bacterium]